MGLPVHTESRAIRVRINGNEKTATLVSQDLHAPALTASFEGNVQALHDGDEFVGWGQQPYFSEFDSTGEMVFDGRFVGDNWSYRTYRYPWTGTPAAPPDVAASASGGTTNVYASWNGATEVSAWRVLAGTSSSALQAVATAPKQDFETQIPIHSEPYVAVQAPEPVRAGARHVGYRRRVRGLGGALGTLPLHAAFRPARRQHRPRQRSRGHPVRHRRAHARADEAQ